MYESGTTPALKQVTIMAQKTKGSRNKTRQKLTKHTRGKDTVSKHLKDFDTGDNVLIQVDSAVHEGMPHPRFHGKHGEVVGSRGDSYIVEISDREKTKRMPVYPAHLQEVDQ